MHRLASPSPREGTLWPQALRAEGIRRIHARATIAPSYRADKNPLPACPTISAIGYPASPRLSLSDQRRRCAAKSMLKGAERCPFSGWDRSNCS